MELKYIVVLDEYGNEAPVIFPQTLIHREVARNYVSDVVGAGFVTLVHGEAMCYGESISLNVKSRGEEDTKLIKDLILKDC